MDAELEAELREILNDAKATVDAEIAWASRQVVYELIDEGGPAGQRVNDMMLEKLQHTL